MAQAIIERQTVDFETLKTQDKYLFRANFQSIVFDGFLKVLPLSIENVPLCDSKEGEIYQISEILPSQHFTQPPARYNDASLVKTLEKYGIGRPSTYATIISILLERGYVIYNEAKSFVPTEIGTITSDLLVKHFFEIADYEMTSKMEENLDLIAEGKKN